MCLTNAVSCVAVSRRGGVPLPHKTDEEAGQDRWKARLASGLRVTFQLFLLSVKKTRHKLNALYVLSCLFDPHRN